MSDSLDFEECLALQTSGQLEAAVVGYEHYLEQYPDDHPALHALALAYVQTFQLTKALPLMEKALSLAPFSPLYHCHMATLQKSIGNIDLALHHYHEAISLYPNYSEAYNNLGTLYYKQARYETAQHHFAKALRINPHYIDAHYNYALCCSQLENTLEAIAHFERVLEYRPTHHVARHNLSILYVKHQNFDKAVLHLDVLIDNDPDNIDALYHRALIYQSQHHNECAMDFYERVTELDPNHFEAHHNLATLALIEGDHEYATYHYQQALDLCPDNDTAAHMLAALTGEGSPTIANPSYVRALFDQYAFNYDEHLKQGLHYQVPYGLRTLLGQISTERPKPWDILDLGCGTGLCAPYLSDIALKLDGVDLSSNMIQIAKSKGGYNHLTTGCLFEYLEHCTKRYDVIIAADVLVYIGELGRLFELCHQRLYSGGIFCFSTENSQEATYHLELTGRFSHNPTYVIEIASQHGFILKEACPVVLRQQHGVDVMGSLWAFCLPSTWCTTTKPLTPPEGS